MSLALQTPRPGRLASSSSEASIHWRSRASPAQTANPHCESEHFLADRAGLAHFVEHALPWFGPYQDAMSTRSTTLFHSGLSFALNVKLLHPREVIDAAVAA
jgi:deoxyribodipyrimidine photolyase-like uncharacterized protein